MVVDKDVEGLGEWTLGEVKTEWVRTLTVLLFGWKAQSPSFLLHMRSEMAAKLRGFLAPPPLTWGRNYSFSEL